MIPWSALALRLLQQARLLDGAVNTAGIQRVVPHYMGKNNMQTHLNKVLLLLILTDSV